MPAGGMRIGGAPLSRWDQPPIAPSVPFQKFGDPNTFTSAATQQAHDYDKIMGNYEDILNRSKSNPLTYSNVSPQLTQYKTSTDVDKSLTDLSGLADTGGYSESDKAALRERGVSPIRSVFSSAQRNIDRAKGLSGGYSPNFGAVTAKMAREQASEIGNAMNNVNAGIAQNVAANRLSAAPAYASAAQRENEARTGAETHNADIMNQINEFNASNNMEAGRFNRGTQLGAVEGMKSLYGTTPALTSLFGQQIGQATQQNQNQQQIDNQKQAQINNSILQPRFRNG